MNNGSSEPNINKDIIELNNVLHQMDLICMYMYTHTQSFHITLHFKEAKHTFSSNAHGTFSKIDHIIGHKTSLKNSRKLKLYQGRT